MLEDLLFRILVLLCVILVIFVRYPYTSGKISKKALFLKIIGLVLLIILLFVPEIDFAKLNLPIVIKLLGLLIYMFGLMFLYKSHRYLGKNWSSQLDLKEIKKHRLITKGPYKKIRHPIYSAQAIIGFGLFLIFPNLILWGLVFIGFIIQYKSNVGLEEKALIKKFGKKYEQYMKKTGRLIPKF